jgi:hypothetical protein
MTSFLNVATSLTGRRWTGPDPAQDRLAEGMAQKAQEFNRAGGEFYIPIHADKA